MVEVSAWFHTQEDADRAIEALKEAGFSEAASLLGRGQVEKERLDSPGGAQGDRMVMVRIQADESRANIARTILNNAGAVDSQAASDAEATREKGQDSDLYDNPFTTRNLHGNS